LIFAFIPISSLFFFHDSGLRDLNPLSIVIYNYRKNSIKTKNHAFFRKAVDENPTQFCIGGVLSCAGHGAVLAGESPATGIYRRV